MQKEDRMEAAVTLEWGVKQSLRGYVEGAGGTIATEGVERTADGGFIFRAAPGEGLRLGADGQPEGTGRFVGEVRFDAHGGMLKMFLADPAVEIGASGAVITVFDTAKRDQRVALALLDLSAAKTEGGELIIPCKLSKDGWKVLGDHYLPMTPLDPVRVVFGG